MARVKNKSKARNGSGAVATNPGRPGQVRLFDPNDDPYGRMLVNLLFPGFLIAIVAGWGLISWQGFPTGTRSGIRAIFLAINAATLTGFDQNPGLGSLNFFGQFIVMILMIVGCLFTTIVASLAVTRIARLPFSDDHVIFAAVLALTIAMVVGVPPLMIGPRNSFQALFLTISAYANCGLFCGELPAASSLLTHLVILPLTVLGGLGVPVLMELWSARFGWGKLSKYSRTALSASALLYVVGFLAIGVLSWPTYQAFSPQAVQSAIRAGSILSIESRTGGLPIVPFGSISQSAQWAVIILMAIGASPGGAGGGLKSTTIVELFRGTRRILAGEGADRSFGIALAWLGIYIAIVLGAATLFSWVNPARTFDGVLVNSVSSASNVGFAVAALPDTPNVMFAHCAVMLVGRLTPLVILWWMADVKAETPA